MKIKKLIFTILISTLSIFLATQFIPNVSLQIIPGKSVYFGIELEKEWQALILVGTTLGLINFFIKPILNVITFPLKIITLGLSSFLLNMLIIFLLDVIFKELEIGSFFALLLTTVLVLISSLIFKV